MTLAAVAFVGALVSGMAQSAIVLNYHRRGYHPAWWLRVVLALAAVVAFGVAAGYLAVLLEFPQTEMIRLYWLRPSFALVLLLVPAISLYALQQAAVHEDMVNQQIEFRQNASHELRTPLTIILGFSEMLRERPGAIDQETMREYLGYIHHQASNMHELVRDLLHFDRAIAVRPLEDGTAVDLGHLVQHVVGMIAVARARPLGVYLATEGDIPPVKVRGLVADLERAINNLVINAVKFSPPGETGGTVRVGLVLPFPGWVMFYVRDTGIGIDPQFIPHLFKAFRQADGTDTRRFGGVGIGLAVVHKIVTAHRGRIEVESEPGKGTTFRVYLRVHDG